MKTPIFRLSTLLILLLSPAFPRAAEFPLSLADALGKTVRFGAPPERIVSLAPSNTELLYALGAEPRIVGVTEHCDYPPEAAAKPHIGGFSTPNLERIVSLEPDLVLAARHNPLETLESLRSLNIPVFILAPASLNDVLQTLRQLGRILGRDSTATRLATRLNARIHAVEHPVANIPPQERPRVIWGRLEAPMYTAGPGSFIHDLIGRAGGRNIAADTGAAWPQVGLEFLVSRDPQVLIVSDIPNDTLAQELERLRRTPGWKEIDAVVNARIHSVPLDLLGRPGPRLVDGLERLARVLHPTRFPR